MLKYYEILDKKREKEYEERFNNSPVKTYKLSEKELEKYRSIEKPKEKMDAGAKIVMTMNKNYKNKGEKEVKKKQENTGYNTLGNLNNVLFEQLDRLNDKDLKGEALREEMQRSKAIGEVAKNIINNGSLVIQAKKMIDDRMDADLKLPKMLEG